MSDTLHNSSPLMHRIAIQSVFLVLVVLCSGWTTVQASSQASQTSQSPQSSPEIRIMVFGDSLSAAYNIDPSLGWVSLMEQRIKKSHPQSRVINASVSGETTLGGKARLKTDLFRHKPTHVLLQLGANDALRGLPLADTRSNLDAMVREIKAARAVPILVGIQIPPNYGLEYAREFRELYPVLAKSHKAGLVPFLLEGIADKPQLFLPDGLHPGAAAQPRLLDNVWPAVQTALRVKS